MKAKIVSPPLAVAGSLVRVAPSPRHGLGVFAERDLPKGQVVHLAPVILLDEDDLNTIDTTSLHGYAYGWTDEDQTAAFALGVGSLFNHDTKPNCEYHRIDAGDVDDAGEVHEFDALQYSTRRAVRRGEELTVDYSGGDPSILWFKPA